MHMCVGAVGSMGALGELVPALGSLLSRGPWGSAEAFWGMWGETLMETRAATDTYVYKHIQLHVGDTCEQTQGVCDMLCDD